MLVRETEKNAEVEDELGFVPKEKSRITVPFKGSSKAVDTEWTRRAYHKAELASSFRSGWVCCFLMLCGFGCSYETWCHYVVQPGLELLV